jgi:hypothetical protein
MNMGINNTKLHSAKDVPFSFSFLEDLEKKVFGLALIQI